jgi:predicted nucleic acid-binding protein
MRYYADSSFLVSCYIVDANTQRAKSALTVVHTPLDFTDLHELEVQNALQLGIFRGDLSAAQAAAARANLRKDLKSGRLVRTVVKWPEVFRAATRLSQRRSKRTGTRSLDVLHVAIAKSFRAKMFLSFDARQIGLASAVGLKVNRSP